MFEAFGLADRLVDEAYWVNEVAFWRPDPDDRTRITRTGRVQDVEEGLSEFPHVIVNQARMLAYLRESHGALGQPAGAVLRPPRRRLRSTDRRAEHPVTVTLQHMRDSPRPARPRRSARSTSSAATARAAASGPRSAASWSATPTNESWGVMDVLAVTDFPDIRLKCAIHSANQGNLLIIPREGGYLVRLYIELDAVDDREMLENRSVTPEKLAAVANRILHPYTLEVKDVGWWSVYEIGQRLCDKFDDVPARDGDPPAAGVHRRRRLPHAQRQGRPGHERVDGRRLEPRVEARRRPARDAPGRSCCTPTPPSGRRSPRS